MPYSEHVKAYLACQIELDRALEYLLMRLEEAGIADKTLIALSSDHYPYGLEKEEIDEIAGHPVRRILSYTRIVFSYILLEWNQKPLISLLPVWI